MPMKYPKISNLINLLFIGFYFLFPIMVAILNPGLPEGVGRFLVFLSFILVALSLIDWYHLYISNTFKGIARGFLSFSSIALVSVFLAAYLSSQSIAGLALFSNPDSWDGYSLLLKFYVVGVGIALIAVLSIPRLLLIKLLADEQLPSYESSI